MNLAELSALLHKHDDGVLRHGKHGEGREFCALEFESKVRGREWSDAPVTLPDIRPMNDARWSSDAARTASLLPVMVALWDWSEWTDARRVAWASYVALETVRQIIAELPGLAESVRTQCREADSLSSATTAAEAAEAATRAATWAATTATAAATAATRAATAARAWATAAVAAEAAAMAAAAAAEAAEAATRAATAAEAATDEVLIVACEIWIAGAEATR